MNKYRVQVQFDVLAPSETEAKKLVELRLYGPDFFNDIKVTSIERIMTPLEKFDFWRDVFRKDIEGKHVENDDANQYHIISYIDAAVDAMDHGALDMVQLVDAWQEVKPWIG